MDGGFGFVCNHCGQINVLAPMAEAPKQAAPEPVDEALPPGMQACPKCAHRQYDRNACHRCGLDFSRVADGTAKFNSDPLHGAPLAEQIRAQWQTLRTQLDDQAAHHAFIGLCAEQKVLEYAGQCYRRMLSVSGHEDPRVRGYRDRVVQQALSQASGLDRRVQEALSTRNKTVLLLVAGTLILAVLAAGFYFINRYQLVLNGG